MGLVVTELMRPPVQVKWSERPESLSETVLSVRLSAPP